MKILVIGAHYDDWEIGCAGTIIKHINNGDCIEFAITSSDEFRTGSIMERLKEQKTVLNLLKVDEKILNLFSYKADIHDIVGLLDSKKPDIIFVPHEHDTHQDHRRSFLIGNSIGRKRNITTVFYAGASTYDFNPNMFSEIDYDKKEELLKCYRSQIKAGAINIDIIRKVNSYYGSLISINDIYAEAFIVKKMRWII